MAGDYTTELDRRHAVDPSLGAWLAAQATAEDLTLLCFEPPDKPCHRRVLAHWLADGSAHLQLGCLL